MNQKVMFGTVGQILDKMPHIIGVLSAVMIVIEIVYCVYNYVGKKEKRELFSGFVSIMNVLLADFIIFALWSVMQLEPGESLSAAQEIRLWVAMIGIVLFNLCTYFLAGTKKKDK